MEIMKLNFMKKYLKKFTIKQESRKKFPSYQNIFQSNLVIGHNSTMLRESIGLKKKCYIVISLGLN